MAEQEQKPHVLIFGAGVVGVTLAQALKKNDIPFTIFERDSGPDARGQGWAITIHWALSSLEACLSDQLRERLVEVQVDPEVGKVDRGNFLFLNAETGEIQHRMPPNKRLRLKRDNFRKLLMEDLAVQWNKKLANIKRNEGGVMAYFEDGTSASGELLVGAEGSKSRTRQILCPNNYQLTPLPVRLIGCSVHLTSSQVAPLRALDPLLFQGLHPETEDFFWFSILDTPATNADGGDYYTVQLLVSWRLIDPVKDEVPSDNAERLANMKRRASRFAEPLRSAILDIPLGTEIVEVKLGDWPCFGWDNFGGRVTLVGDAAHAMTMYRGEAANHGLMDVANLAEALKAVSDGKASLGEAVDAYETEMRKRTAPAVLLSRQACLDAHDWNKIKSGNAAVLAKRVVALKED
ncbi:FAD/NAD(P)-binding domain-containing protein [Tuber magnatum]|uniref:FAD/NAD(P)-binding domain-containing protein n=1 Tax=Tuber magnatum TaxID=42249 RepID=A0A317SMT1_9PEZI|nr:FAD/NAD(P)-binding domain-containing protein [Tuber magnatum]